MDHHQPQPTSSLTSPALTTHPSLLVVDDDLRLRELLEKFLSAQGFTVYLAENALEAKDFLSTFRVDAIILDIMMPGQTGLEFLSAAQGRLPAPVLVLSAKYDVDDRIQGLEYGADDYLAKPFDPKELVLRVQTILRRTSAQTVSVSLFFGACEYNPQTKMLWKQGVAMGLSAVEAQLLDLFIAHEGTPLAREDVCQHLAQPHIHPRSVDVQITRLRRKIERDPKTPEHLLTVRHAGYVFWRHHRV